MGFLRSTCRGRNCQGIECLSGIPGSVGGTPVQNVGAYGQEVAETIASVLTLDLKDGQIRELRAEACGFRYRCSIFNTSERGRYIILQVTFALIPGGTPRIEYADLKKYFAGWNKQPTLAEVREAVRKIRAGKGMLISAGDEDSRSAGSFFKNPIVSAAQHEELEERAAARGLQIPSYPALETQKKISAAWLVEHSGFSKGYELGKSRHLAQAYSRHCESWGSHRLRHRGVAKAYPRTRTRDLGSSAGAGAGICRILVFWYGPKPFGLVDILRTSKSLSFRLALARRNLLFA